MLHAIKRAVLAIAMVATAAGAATTAEARDRYYGHRRGGDDAAIAIGAGVVGLALGAALASDHHRRGYYRDRYYPRSRYRTYYRYDSYPSYYYNSYPQYYRTYPRYRTYTYYGSNYRNRYYGNRYYGGHHDRYSNRDWRYRSRGW